MVLMLGAMQLLGLEPGPGFLKNHADLAVGLVLTLAVANLLGAALMLALARPVAQVAQLRGRIIAPLLLAAAVLGVYAAGNRPVDLVVMFFAGALGWLLQRHGFSRAAFVLGFILGDLVETYLAISLQAYGIGFLLQPAPLVIAFAVAALMLWRPVLLPRLRGQ